ncbi:CCR4-NOT transcription complex subunit 1, partial [Sarcoptes scabiei]
LKILGSAFFQKLWKINLIFQLDFIKFCIENNHIESIFNACAEIELNKEINESQSLHSTSNSDNSMHQTWKYFNLYRLLIEFSKIDFFQEKVVTLLSTPLDGCPETLIFGLIEFQCHEKSRFRSIIIEAIKKVINPIDSNSSHFNNTTHIFQKLWSTTNTNLNVNSSTQKLLLDSMIEVYNDASSDDQPNKLLCILEIAQELRALTYLLNESPYLFAIDLASVASRREYLKLDKWINDKLSFHRESFADACKNYIQKRLMSATESSKCATPWHVETLSVILSCLQHYYCLPDCPNARDIKDIFKIFHSLTLNVNPLQKEQHLNSNNGKNIPIAEKHCSNQVMNSKSSTSTTPSFVNPSFTSSSISLLDETDYDLDVQKKSDLILKNIFSQLAPDQEFFVKILDFFFKLKTSKEQTQNDILKCVLQILIKELDFIAQYPRNELLIMAELIGGIIAKKLIDNNLFSFILQKLYYIFNLSKRDAHLSNFSIRILERCLPRFKQIPPLYEKLKRLELPGLVFEKIEQNNSLECFEFGEEDRSNKEIDFKERLNFVFNNLDGNNVSIMAKNFQKDCQDNHLCKLLAECLCCRAVNELNHHQLFFDLIELIDSINLYELIVIKCYETIKMHLSKADHNDQNKRLCSCGRWLGLITLKRNKPILTLHLDLHSLLNEARRKNLTFYIVPFICRILSSCGESKVFRPPNPWVMSLLKILTQIYIEPDCRLKIKFEMESLFKALELDLDQFLIDTNNNITSIIPSCNSIPEYLKPSSRADELDSMKNVHEISNTLNNFQQTATIASSSANCFASNLQSTDFSYDLPKLLKSLIDSIQITPNIKLLQCPKDFEKMLRYLVVKSIQEWVTSFHETFYGILMTIECLIRKDFVVGTNSEVIKKALINMSNYFVSGCTLINCKEKLPISMAEKLCNSFNENIVSSHLNKKLIEDVILTIIIDNFDLALKFCRMIFIDKAIEELMMRMQCDLLQITRKNSSSKQITIDGDEELMFYNYLNYCNLFDVNSSALYVNNSQSIDLQQCREICSNLIKDEELCRNQADTNIYACRAQTQQNDGDRINEKVELIFDEWLLFFNDQSSNYKTIHNELYQSGYFKNEEKLYAFFKSCFNLCYSRSNSILEIDDDTNNNNEISSNTIDDGVVSDNRIDRRDSSKNQYLSHYRSLTAIDAFIYLVLFWIKFEKYDLKITVLDRLMTDISTKAHEEQRKSPKGFNPICYYRVLVLFYLEFISDLANQNEAALASFNNDMDINSNSVELKISLLQIFHDFLKSMSPSNIPSFTFAWIEFVSHRAFVGFCLSEENPRQIWQLYYNLLKDLLEFEKPFFMIDGFKNECFNILHKGTIKLFFLLLHDFPNFLAQYCFLICDELPLNALQFRNIVLSAYPPPIALPVPFTGDFSMNDFDQLLHNFQGEFSTNSPMKSHIDVYLKTGKVFHLKKLPPYFESAKSLEIQIEYINRVLYSISDFVLSQNRLVDLKTIDQEPSIDIINCLLDFFDPIRWYYLFSAMSNHLRYPNIETKYFVCLMLYFFKTYSQYKEPIMRVLLERSFVSNPHPWGLLFTLKELIRNPSYQFKEFLSNLTKQEQE